MKAKLKFLIFAYIFLCGFSLVAVLRPSPIEYRLAPADISLHREYCALRKSVYIPPEVELTLDEMIFSVCDLYSLNPKLVAVLIQRESNFNPDAVNYNGSCIGLMQVSTKWHSSRAERLGVTDLFDPYGNVLTGCDYLHELFEKYEDPGLVLMLWHMRHDRAFELYSQGIIDKWSMSILREAEVI